MEQSGEHDVHLTTCKPVPFDPSKPQEGDDLDAVEIRDQFNGLKAFIDAQTVLITALQTQNTALLAQLAPILPLLNHDDEGAWSVSFGEALPALWQVWVRSNLNTDWSNTAAYAPADFPSTDSGLCPPGALWWQIKICGSDSGNNPLTPFSNVISVGAVPGA